MADKLSVDEFALKVKEKYPEYANIDNSELAKMVIEKYPEYANQVDLGFTTEDATRFAGGLVADVAIAESARIGGTAAGAAAGSFVPIIGTAVGAAVGYVAGGLTGGATGSITRQRITNPDGDISYGEVVADAFLNLIPGSKAVKGGSAVTRVLKNAGRLGATGVAAGVLQETIETGIEEKRLPTLGELGEQGITTGMVSAGLGVSSSALEKAYQKFGGLPASTLNDALKANDPDAKVIVDGVVRNAREYSENTERFYQDSLRSIETKFSDEFTYARVLQDQSGGGQYVNKNGVLKVVKDEEDYYLQRRLAEAKIMDGNKRIQETLKLDQNYLEKKAKDLNVNAKELSDSVDEYLYAKHAISYNQSLGDEAAGIDTARAKGIVDAFEGSGFLDEIKYIIDSRRNASKRILDVLVDGGLISPSEANKMRTKYPDYVPLNRIIPDDSLDDTAQIVLPELGSKYETKFTGVRKAKGNTDLEVKPITQNIYENLAGAIRRAEVNKANMAFKKLLEANPSQQVAKIRKPRIIGTKKVTDDSLLAQRKRAAGEKVDKIESPIYENDKDNVLSVFDMGQRYSIEFTDKNIAKAMKGKDKRQAGLFLKAALIHNRTIGSLYTRFNPDFIAPNIVRDRQEAFVNNLSKMDVSEAFKGLNPVNDMRTIYRNLAGAKPRTDKEIELDQLYKDFRESGGSSGGLGLSTLNSIEEQVSKMTTRLTDPPNTIARKVTSFVNGVNEIAEDATRFGTYRRAIASGLTKDQAALAARNSSFDPLLSGTESDVLKATYLFFNPALQSAKNTIRSLKNPKVAASVMGGLTAISFAIDSWNSSIDPEWREKVSGADKSSWKVNKNLIILTGRNDDGTVKYNSIPIGYSLVPYKVGADIIQRKMRGEDVGSNRESAKLIANEFLDAYNPTGGSLVPTVLKPWWEIAVNKDGLGRDIRPSWLEQRNMDATEKVYPWTAETVGGEMAMVLADNLKSLGHETSPENLLHLYQTYTGGPGKTVERLFDVTAKLYNNEPISKRDIPIARRFFGESFAELNERRNNEISIIENIDKQENTESAKNSRVAYNLFRSYKDADNPRAGIIALRTAVQSSPDANEGVIRRLEDMVKKDLMGISYTDNSLRQLGVKNGARARAYIEILKTMEPNSRRAYLSEQVQKKILTEDVQRQLLAEQQLIQLLNGNAGTQD